MTQKQFEKLFKQILGDYEIKVDKDLKASADTALGGLEITCRDGWIAMRFTDEDFSVSNFYALFSQNETFNVWSFKWNIHFEDRKDVLIELDERLNILML
jgi:hypothetical protein